MMENKNEKTNEKIEIRKDITIGTDESGNGDLFVEVSFAADKKPKKTST